MTHCPNFWPSDDGDFLRVLAETTLNRLMDFAADNAIGAALHERSPERVSYRNGCRDRVAAFTDV